MSGQGPSAEPAPPANCTHQPEGLAALQKLPVFMAHGLMRQGADGSARHSHKEIGHLEPITQAKEHAEDRATEAPEHLLFFDAGLLSHHNALQHLTGLEAEAMAGHLQHGVGIGNTGAELVLIRSCGLNQ